MNTTSLKSYIVPHTKGRMERIKFNKSLFSSLSDDMLVHTNNNLSDTVEKRRNAFRKELEIQYHINIVFEKPQDDISIAIETDSEKDKFINENLYTINNNNLMFVLIQEIKKLQKCISRLKNENQKYIGE